MLAIDAGQSACRVFVRNSVGQERWLEAAGVIAGHDPLDAALEAVKRALESSGEPTDADPIDTVAVGLTGLHGRAGDARRLLDQLRPYGARRVIVADDCVTSFFGAIGPNPGVVIAAGTGVCALAIDGAGRHRRVDGWGPLLGDAGGGYWVGRRGMVEAIRAYDGKAGSPELLRRLQQRTADVAVLPARLAVDPQRVSWVAGFAPDVADAARDGDESARSIWTQAAHFLAETAEAAARPLFDDGPVTVSYTGRLFDAGDVLLDPFLADVGEQLPDATVLPARGKSLDGAVYLAEQASPPDLPPLLSVATTGSGR